jgi:hypothetical protein
MNVSANSTANFDNATLSGSGTLNIQAGGTVDAKTISAGLHVNVANGGVLSLLSPSSGEMSSVGMIHEAAGGRVFIGGLPMSEPGPLSTATSEVFHEASGTLDLLNKSGAQVASLQFAPGSHEYTSTVSSRGAFFLDITTNPALLGTLHTTFTH